MTEYILPDPVVIETHLPTNHKTRGYTAAQMHQAYAAGVEALGAQEPAYYLWENAKDRMLSSNTGPHPDYKVTPLYAAPVPQEPVNQMLLEALKKIAANKGNGDRDGNIARAAIAAAEGVKE